MLLRRLAPLAAFAVALVCASAASSALQPIRRAHSGELAPRIRQGPLRIPTEHTRGRLRVIVRLALPPLAAAYSDGLGVDGNARKLSVHSASSRDYLARLDRAQSAAAAGIRRAVPGAVVSRRFRVVLDGLTVELPVRGLTRLTALPFVTKVYPSLAYHLTLDESPGLIRATTFWSSTGARGEGVKIGVVDDGVDEKHVFFTPTGMSYPAGFPKGGRSWTTPKVIVARSFPGPTSGRRGRLPIDRKASFHGTHVAGIAAGRSGTSSPGGRDHPPTPNLSGIAPNAWIGNYRVFNIPTRIGYTANSPEIVAAFEAAVADGMDVINFSGGASETDPVNDVLVEAVHNVSAAGVVPVIAAGNSREDFGLGSVDSPGSAPDAISVAASSNLHVFAQSLSVQDARAPSTLRNIPFRTSLPRRVLGAWETQDQTLVDVGSIVGTDNRPVDRLLCGVSHPNALDTTLPAGSLTGSIALVSRGGCAIVTKELRALFAGASGVVLVDNRSGEANELPLDIPAGTVADLDGARLRAFLGSVGGRSAVRFNLDPQELQTGRGGIITSFSSAGPTAFGHLLKPDVTAPGGEILSSTLPEFAGAPFASFNGTSMATPHVAGAAALLVERHPGWTPLQVRSALVSTAGPAWADTARTTEASVFLEGGGLVDVPRADDPQIFTEPSSLSLGDLNVKRGAARRALAVEVTDAGGGSGIWSVQVQPQSASSGASIEVPGLVAVAPGGRADLSVVASATAQAAAGDDYGFLVMRTGAETRRIPYAFFVTRPALQDANPVRLRQYQTGTTQGGASFVQAYRWPAAPFGYPPSFTGPSMVEDGVERVYVVPHLSRPVVNLGVSVVSSSAGAVIDPWLLGSLDENDVQGPAGTPVDVNPMTPDFGLAIGAAGAAFPRLKRYYVSVDSTQDLYTGRSSRGRYRLRYWVNDLRPPKVRLLTRRVAAGRPTLAISAQDTGAGVDPYSILLAYRGVVIGAVAYDAGSGVAVFELPRSAPRLVPGRTRGTLGASDFQEAKNINTFGPDLMPNTRFRDVRIQAVRGTTVTWLLPRTRGCVRGSQDLIVLANSTGRVRAVRFFDGARRIGIDRHGVSGLYAVTWRARSARRGHHRLRAVVTSTRGGAVVTSRVVSVCR
jgi:minor extracellular serine protease Vpr